MLKTFDPGIAPSPGTRKSRRIKILEADFGDGYSQPTPDGFNHMRRLLTLQWDALSNCDADEIVSFFEEHGGTIPFYYAPVGEARPVKWMCKTWDDTHSGIRKITAEFEQSFTLSG